MDSPTHQNLQILCTVLIRWQVSRHNILVSFCLIGSMIAVAFQSVFRAEIHQNDIFLFFKKLFLRSTHQNYQKHIQKFLTKIN